jgi:hypothetical protein
MHPIDADCSSKEVELSDALRSLVRAGSVWAGTSTLEC